jgi:hypothetical protein
VILAEDLKWLTGRWLSLVSEIVNALLASYQFCSLPIRLLPEEPRRASRHWYACCRRTLIVDAAERVEVPGNRFIAALITCNGILSRSRESSREENSILVPAWGGQNG